jgi:tripartite-type tricarboxylate transporter receptor subunit TctC
MRILRGALMLCAGMAPAAALASRVVVEHRSGAGGIVGQEQVARASPDGYTLVVSSLGSFIISPVFTPVPFDPFRDFTHGGQPVALLANKDLPFGTLSDLVAYATSRPGAVTYATISIGSQTQLRNERFQAQARIKMTHVLYRGVGQIVTDAGRTHRDRHHGTRSGGRMHHWRAWTLC